MPTLLFLLMASSGSYDDATTWVVASFLSLEEAEAYRGLAHEASVAAIAAYREASDSQYAYFDEPTRYDLTHSVRDTVVRYWLEPVPLIQGALPQAGLLAHVDAYATAMAQTRELNHRHQERLFARPLPRCSRQAAPELLASVQHDFGSKLAQALNVSEPSGS